MHHSLSQDDRNCLLRLARKSIADRLSGRLNQAGGETEHAISPALLEKRGSFVTLHLDGSLRGCIGKIHGGKRLYEDIIDNSISAAFADPRFPPVSPEELGRINIEVSVLTLPVEIRYRRPGELLSRLRPDRDGIVLKDKTGYFQSVFLPQVWRQIPDREEFLSHLSLKAGMDREGWKASRIFRFSAEAWDEKGSAV